jgi:insertion element IS1 protein InsB
VAFYWFKKNKKWIIKAVDRSTGRTVAWVIGGRDTATFRRLYAKVRHLKNCIFYTDDWDAFAKVLPKDRHIIGKSHTVTIERDNSNTRHHLGRMTRRTKVVSKKVEMIDASMKLWCALTTPETFQQYQEAFLSIFM